MSEAIVPVVYQLSNGIQSLRLRPLELEEGHRVKVCELSPTFFLDLDLSFEGGESSRTAMTRGIAVVHQAMQEIANSVIIVTHGNLMTLILKYFNEQIGYAEWEKFQNPDVYRVKFSSEGNSVEQMV